MSDHLPPRIRAALEAGATLGTVPGLWPYVLTVPRDGPDGPHLYAAETLPELEAALPDRA